MLSHLIELRQRLVVSLSLLSVIFLVLMYYARPLFALLALPLLQQLPGEQQLIAIGIASPIWIPLKFAFVSALVIAAPVLLYQLWHFIAPGLYQHEKQSTWLYLSLSIVLFYAGIAFCYFVALPMIFQFLMHFTPTGIQYMPDIAEYLDFCLKLCFAFGLCFEVPIACIILTKTGLAKKQQLKAARPYVLVTSFILGMLLTPPDVLSQVLLAIPMYTLYELGILLGRD